MIAGSFHSSINQYDALIVANGDQPNKFYTQTLVASSPLIVCCDGAANDFIHNGGKPDVIVGDGDSISSINKEKYKDILHLSNDQETNDLTKAFKYCVAAGKRNICIIGATGKREDHTLGNISLLMDYMKEAHVEMITNYGVFTPASGETTFDSYPGQQVSIFNFGSNQMEGEGLQYPLRGFTKWWQGTLNAATANSFMIRATGDYLVFRVFTSV